MASEAQALRMKLAEEISNKIVNLYKKQLTELPLTELLETIEELALQKAAKLNKSDKCRLAEQCNGFASWDSPSLDKLDPLQGYMENNVVWCLYSVNAFKHTLTYEQFTSKLAQIKWRA